MVKWLSYKKTKFILIYLIGIVGIILINRVSSDYFVRYDMTEENRYSLKEASIELLQNLDDNVYVEVYLEGELNPGFKRLQKGIRETLKEFERVADGKVIYKFINPETAVSREARNEYMADIASRGITPTNVIDTRDGNRVERIVFPGALISYGGREKGVMLLSGSRGEEELNNSIENVEFNLIKTIYQLTAIERPKVGFLKGHSETDSLEIISFQNALFEYYDIEEIDIRLEEKINNVDILIVAKPERSFNEGDKFKIDQFIMRGGSVLFMIDKLEANMDSTSRSINYAFPYKTNLDDMLFQYGVRLNNDLIQDNSSALFPVVVGNLGDEPQIRRLPWPYYPIFNNFANHPISRNMGAILGRFSSSIDTVKADGIEKTILVSSSNYSRTLSAPVNVSLDELRKNLKAENLTKKHIPVAVLLEGAFESVFRNRILPEGVNGEGFQENGDPAKILVIADGDFATNYVDNQSGEPLPLGHYPYQKELRFSNLDFLINAVSYMVDESGIISARSKEIKIRPLDKVKIAEEKLKWQLINIALPLSIVLLGGVVLFFIRKTKNTGFHGKA